MQIIRIGLLLNALIAFFSCTGLCISAIFNSQTPKFSGLYWQYWIYFGTFVLSILVAIILSVHLLYYGMVRHARAICLTPLMLFLTTLATCIVFDDKTPWTDIKTDQQSPILGGLFLHCALYTVDHDPTYPALYYRCMLVDATWLSGVLLGLLWLVLFFILWFTCTSCLTSSPTQSTMQVYKYQISDSHSKFCPPSLTSETSIASHHINHANKKKITDIGQQQQQQLKYLTYLPTKSLPPLNQRPSEDTLCLPIHSNTTTAIGPTYGTGTGSSGSGSGGGDSLFRGSIQLQPHEEKVQVSDSWLQNFGPSIDFTTPLTPPSTNYIKNYTYSHSMDLGWMKRMNQHHNNTNDHTTNDDDDNDDEEDSHRIQQRDGGFIYPNSRRMVIAQSCPEFNNKKMKKLLNTSSNNGTDDVSLRY